MPRPKLYLGSNSGIADELLPKKLFFLVVECRFGHCGCGRPHPAAATAVPHTHCISKKRAAKRAPKEALPQQGRLMPGRYGSADRRGAFLAISLETGFTPALKTEP